MLNSTLNSLNLGSLTTSHLLFLMIHDCEIYLKTITTGQRGSFTETPTFLSNSKCFVQPLEFSGNSSLQFRDGEKIDAKIYLPKLSFELNTDHQIKFQGKFYEIASAIDVCKINTLWQVDAKLVR